MPLRYKLLGKACAATLKTRFLLPFFFFFCFGLGRSMTVHLHWFPVISYAVIVHKEKRTKTGIDSNSDRFYASASQSSAAAPEPHRTNISLL